MYRSPKDPEHNSNTLPASLNVTVLTALLSSVSLKFLNLPSLPEYSSCRSNVPGNNFSDNYSITLKDVDTAVLNHVKNVMKPMVREANETLKIPVFYGNEERWKAVRNRGVLRD